MLNWTLAKSRLKAWSLATAGCALLALSRPNACAAYNQGLVTFSKEVHRPQHQNATTDYNIDPRTSRFFVYVPTNYTSAQSFGLIVYISWKDDAQGLPPGWAEVLERRKLMFICPQNAGNNLSEDKRSGLAVLGALEMMANYNVDKSRVYAAGLSGGARTACDLGFVQSDLFCGTIQACGSEFYRAVQARYATSETDTNGNRYGVCAVRPSEVAEAKAKTRFVLITGAGDFRRGNILDIYYGGFALERFRAKLIDVPNMGHQDCDGKTLEEALDFLK